MTRARARTGGRRRRPGVRAGALLLGSALLAGSPLADQDEGATPDSRDTDDPAVEERVRVEERVDPLGAQDIAAFATVLDGGELRARGEDLAGLLRRVPGARVREYGGLGSYSTLSLRASTADQVPVFVDGVLQNRALGGPFNLSSLPVAEIERVTVFRGFAPAALGLGGIGGAVDVRTRAPRDARVEASQLLGELGTSRTHVGAALPLSGGHLRLGAERLGGDGDFPFLDENGTPVEPGDDVVRARPNNDVERRAFSLNGRWSDVGQGELALSLRRRDADRGVPPSFLIGDPRARLAEENTELQAAWTRRRDGTLREMRLELAAFADRSSLDSRGLDFGAPTDTTTRTAGATLSGDLLFAERRATDRLLWEVARERAEVTDLAFDVSDRGGARRTRATLTWERVQPAGPVHLAPSVRVDALDDTFLAGGAGTVPPPAGDVSSVEAAGKLGVAWRPAPRTTLAGSVGRNVRRPSLSERFGNRGAIVGNPELRSERAWAAELGVATEGGGGSPDWNVQVVAFARRSEDLVQLTPVGLSAVKPLNVGEAQVAGVELAAELELPRGFGAAATATWQDTEDRNTGRRLLFQPELLGSGGLRWTDRAARVAIRWDVTYTGSNLRNSIDFPSTRLPERWVHDASLIARVGRGLELGLDVQNVFDRRQVDVYEYPLPDRVVSVHLGWRSRPEKKP